MIEKFKKFIQKIAPIKDDEFQKSIVAFKKLGSTANLVGKTPIVTSFP